MTLRTSFNLFLVVLTLSGCIGTKLTKRSTDTSQPYPSLHSVPERPPKINFQKTDVELEDFGKDYEKKIKLNEQVRKSTPPVKKPKESF